jgi:hypothetical protein
MQKTKNTEQMGLVYALYLEEVYADLRGRLHQTTTDQTRTVGWCWLVLLYSIGITFDFSDAYNRGISLGKLPSASARQVAAMQDRG